MINQNNPEEDKATCEVCGRIAKGKFYNMPLWDYGIRIIKKRFCCNSCIKAQERGEL